MNERMNRCIVFILLQYDHSHQCMHTRDMGECDIHLPSLDGEKEGKFRVELMEVKWKENRFDL